MVEYLGCLLDENISGGTMTRMVLKQVNRKKKFLWQGRNLSYPVKGMIGSTLL